MKMGDKITLPTAIVITGIVLATSFYAVQYNKQISIERQQMLQLQQDKAMEEAKAEQAEKEYVANRKADCLKIFESESEKWTNVRGWRYSEEDDRCFIRYKDLNPKSDTECDKSYPTGNEWGYRFDYSNSLCKEGEFENSY